MYRRAYALMVGTAVLMGGLAVVASVSLDKSLADPEGSFLGPSYIRLPLLLLGALLLDMLPRTLWYSRLNPKAMPEIVRNRWRAHWNRERITLVALGIICFYVVYVSYRNLKSFLPFINETMYDRELHLLDRALFFGHEPATVLHGMFGTVLTAYVLSYIYLAFLPMVPLGVTAWVVWSRNLSFGYWFVTSQCLAWTLGTLSYYALPTLGPGLEYVYLYNDLADTPTSGLMDSLVERPAGRPPVRARGTGAVRRRVRQPALRHHAAPRADGAVHDPVEGRQVDRVGELRAHRARDPLLRLALHRRRPRGHRDRDGELLHRRHRERSEVRPQAHHVAPHHDDSLGACRPGLVNDIGVVCKPTRR